jgi:CO dehydrogenase maturation factor
MKIAISGKGGVGKSTLTALLTQAWARAGIAITAIDADPSGNLARYLGFPAPDKIKPIIDIPGLVAERTGAQPDQTGQIYKLNPRVADIPEKFAPIHNGIRLIVMGRIKSGGSGCACPENTLLKSLLQHLILERDEYLILDMEAGLEHLGRGTAQGVNLLLVVVEPSLASIEVARKIKHLARDIGIKNIYAVANKIHSPEDQAFITAHLKNIKIIGFLPFSRITQNQERNRNRSGRDTALMDELKTIQASIIRYSS